MLTVPRLAPGTTHTSWTADAHTRQHVTDRLTYWREHLLEHQAGSNLPTGPEIRRQLDRWLDELNDIRGR